MSVKLARGEIEYLILSEILDFFAGTSRFLTTKKPIYRQGKAVWRGSTELVGNALKNALGAQRSS